MAALGPYSFFAFETVVAVAFAGFVVYRVRRRPPLPADEQEAFVAVPSETLITTALDPRTGGKAGGPAAAESQLGEPADSTKVAGPTASLDSKRAGRVMDLLRKLAQEQDAAIIVVTHDEKIFDRFDRIFHLRDGRLESIEDKKPEASEPPARASAANVAATPA